MEQKLDESAIEKLLVDDWASGLRITTVPQAMRRLSFADNLDSRWRMADRLYGVWQSSLRTPEKVQEVATAVGLKNSSDLDELSQRWRNQVVTWGRASILLTENEKLTARYIWARHLEGEPLTQPENTAAALDLPAQEVNNGVQMLTRLGFLSPLSSPQGNSPINGYTLAEGADRFLEGLGFFFHTVTLDGLETFGIP